MIRTLRALAWMRFRLFVNSMMGTGRRGTLEQVSRALASVLPLVLAIALVPSAIALAVAGFIGGRYLAGGGEHTASLILGIRLGLFSLTLMVGLLPLVRSAGGKESGQSRLLLLPIPRSVLLVSQLTAGFGDPWLALAVPLLLALPVGLAAGGAASAAVWVAISSVVLLLTLAGLNACSSLGLTLLFRDRRRGELLTFVFMSVLTVLFLFPAACPDTEDWFDEQSRDDSTQTARLPLDQRVDRLLPRPLRALPGELYGGLLKSASSSRDGGTVQEIVLLSGMAAWCVGLIALAGAMHRRLLESPAGGSRRQAARKSDLRVRRFPGLTHAASAVALATARTALRTVRGKIAVYLNFAVLGLILLMYRTQIDQGLSEGSPIGPGQLAALSGIAFSLISMQPVTLNLLAIDQAGLTLQFLAPVSSREIVLGKMAAAAGLVGLSTALCTAVSVVVSPHGSAAAWIALLPVYVSTNLILGPLFVLLSAVFPKHADLSRLGKAGNPHNMAGLVGFLLVPLVLAPPVLLAGVALLWLDDGLLAVVLPAAWTLVSAALFVPLLRIAVAAVTRCSDNLLLVAVGR